MDQAVKIFDHKHFEPETARVRFKRGKVFQATGKLKEAEADFAIALRLYNELNGPSKRASKIEDLNDSDFDHKIMFWSR